MMHFPTPAFWYDDAPAARLLAPFAGIYRAGHWLRQRHARPYRSTVPVVCVGNLVAGGGGKTPAALAVMAMARDEKLARNPCFLTRGYGGRERGPLLVDPARHGADAVGDEALLLAAVAPTIVSADRAAGARLAERQSFDLIVMDDGLQNPGLAKTLRFIVIDGASGFGNGRVLPAGPLRETPKSGLAQADAFIFIGDDKKNTLSVLPLRPILHATVQPVSGWRAPAGKVVAFAGLARPEKFRATIDALGLDIAAWLPFPDHHVYTGRDLRRIDDIAAARQATPLTTAKDAVKLPRDFAWRTAPQILPVELVWSAPAQLRTLLMQAMATQP